MAIRPSIDDNGFTARSAEARSDYDSLEMYGGDDAHVVMNAPNVDLAADQAREVAAYLTASANRIDETAVGETLLTARAVKAEYGIDPAPRHGDASACFDLGGHRVYRRSVVEAWVARQAEAASA